MQDSKIKFCPMLTGKEEVKALTIGQGDCVIPTFHVCLQEHCAAFVEKYGGEKWCNHYHSSVEYKSESEGGIMKGYLRPKNTTKSIEKAKYEAFKSQCIRITSLCALAVLNDLWDASNEDMQEWYDNYERLIASIFHDVDNLDNIEKQLIEECGIKFEER